MRNVNMEYVSSSNVESVGHDAMINTLYVNFLNGGRYSYSGVSISEYEGLKNASSVGTYLNAHIKGKYPFRKL